MTTFDAPPLSPQQRKRRLRLGVGLDPERVRALVRQALGDTEDASVRVYHFEATDEPITMVTVKPPSEMATPQRLRSTRYQRRTHTSSTSPPTKATTAGRHSSTAPMRPC